MRTDMHKIVVERERGGGTDKNRKWGKRLPYVDSDYEEEIGFASSARRRQYGWSCKWLTDVLRPLEGYLRKNLGRPWDKVYGELRRGLDVRKITGMHIFDHVKWMVATECYVDEKGTVRQVVKDLEVAEFFVHPKTGLLGYVGRPSRRWREKEDLRTRQIDEVTLDRTTSYRLLNGQWYWVKHEFVRLEPGSQLPNVWDVAMRQNAVPHYGVNRIAVAKQQCSREQVVEIRRSIAEWEKRVRRM
jgi:hypothetical protein